MSNIKYQISLLLICFGMFSCGEDPFEVVSRVETTNVIILEITNVTITPTNTNMNPSTFSINTPEWIRGTWQSVGTPYPLTNEDSWTNESYRNKFTADDFIQIYYVLRPMSDEVIRSEENSLINSFRQTSYHGADHYYEQTVTKVRGYEYSVDYDNDGNTESTYDLTIVGFGAESEGDDGDGDSYEGGRFQNFSRFIKTGTTNMIEIQTHVFQEEGFLAIDTYVYTNRYFKLP